MKFIGEAEDIDFLADEEELQQDYTEIIIEGDYIYYPDWLDSIIESHIDRVYESQLDNQEGVRYFILTRDGGLFYVDMRDGEDADIFMSVRDTEMAWYAIGAFEEYPEQITREFMEGLVKLMDEINKGRDELRNAQRRSALSRRRRQQQEGKYNLTEAEDEDFFAGEEFISQELSVRYLLSLIEDIGSISLYDDDDDYEDYPIGIEYDIITKDRGELYIQIYDDDDKFKIEVISPGRENTAREIVNTITNSNIDKYELGYILEDVLDIYQYGEIQEHSSNHKPKQLNEAEDIDFFAGEEELGTPQGYLDTLVDKVNEEIERAYDHYTQDDILWDYGGDLASEGFDGTDIDEELLFEIRTRYQGKTIEGYEMDEVDSRGLASILWHHVQLQVDWYSGYYVPSVENGLLFGARSFGAPDWQFDTPLQEELAKLPEQDLEYVRDNADTYMYEDGTGVELDLTSRGVYVYAERDDIIEKLDEMLEEQENE